tara:strand:- start:36 stop:1223 length:1188 start_codon:yes stop_codon:yes gene_type:complete
MTTQKGVWNLQQVRDKQLQSLWTYSGPASDNTKLFVWGYAGNNAFGVLGQNEGGAISRSSPVQIPGSWVRYARSFATSWGIKTDGTLWGWGNQPGGQVGDNTIIARSSPVQIGSGTDWGAVGSTGFYGGSVAIKTDGTLWVWGHNDEGQLGLNQSTPTRYSSPVQIPGTNWSTAVKQFSGAYQGLQAIKTDGTLWMWGANGSGGLGQNNKTKYSSPVQVPGTTWSQTSGGQLHTAALKTDGTLWTWGEGYSGQLGNNLNATARSSPIQIPGSTWSHVTCNMGTTYAIKTDGTLWAWGDNNSGQMGNNIGSNNGRRSSPAQIPGTTWNWVAGLGGYAAIASKTDGTLWSWGANSTGELGLNDVVYRSSPTQVPGTWSMDNGNQNGFNVNGAGFFKP